jgi:hypothetical protein
MKGEKVILYNDLHPKIDQKINGDFYDQENNDTAVIYLIENLYNQKAYIGKAFSYEKHGDQKPSRYGAKGRFRRHWSNCKSELANDECPVFYEALRNSKLDDWFVHTIKVCSKKHLKEWEAKMIKLYKTSDPEYGYNYFVGDSKPNNEQYLEKYQTAKAKTNVERAINGKMKRTDKGKNLPPNINYRLSRRKDGTVIGEGYFVQIKLYNKLYNKAFLSNDKTMDEKLEMAKKQLELFKKEAEKNKFGSKSTKNNGAGSKTGIIKKK